MAKAKGTGKNQEKQRQIDPVFKQALTDELANLPVVLQTEVEVSRLPRTIDAIITINGEGALQTVRTNTPFFYDQRGEFERGKESQPTLVVG